MRITASLLLFFVMALVSGCNQSNRSGEEASPGEQAYRANCGSCHRFYSPSTRTGDQWLEIIGEHRERTELSDSTWIALTEYLTSAH